MNFSILSPPRTWVPLFFGGGVKSFVRRRILRTLVNKTAYGENPLLHRQIRYLILHLSNGKRAAYRLNRCDRLKTNCSPSLVDVGCHQKTRLGVSACLPASFTYSLPAYLLDYLIG